MRYFSVQKRVVIDSVQRTGGVYQPDFAKSDYLRSIPDLAPLYRLFLESFNRLNGTDLPGLVFGFHSAMDNDGSIRPFAGYDEFKRDVRRARAAVGSLWRHFSEQDVVVAELDYEQPFNPLYIDINDFQFLMPPIMCMPPYEEADIDRLVWAVERGIAMASPLPSGLVQACMPCIAPENIVGVYPMFSLEAERPRGSSSNPGGEGSFDGEFARLFS